MAIIFATYPFCSCRIVYYNEYESLYLMSNHLYVYRSYPRTKINYGCMDFAIDFSFIFFSLKIIISLYWRYIDPSTSTKLRYYV